MSQKRNKNDALPHPVEGGPSKIEVFKLIDDLNIKIVKELVKQPDISSTEISARYGVPLSTVQRRRARLEQVVLKKSYALDLPSLGWRIADLLITVEKGKAEEMAKKLLQDGKNNVVAASLRIGHPQVDIMAEVFYRDSQELHRLTETIKSMEYVTFVEWVEVVKVVGNNLPNMIERMLRDAKAGG